MFVVKWLCPALLAFFVAAPARAITPEQAQTLPLAELAKLVLGEVGVLAVDVDRPKWPTCEIGCEPLTQEQLKQPPPLFDGLSFYTRIGPGGMTEKWTGLCTYDIIGVSFDAGGTPNGIGRSARWGAPHGMSRAAIPATVENLPAQTEAAREKCAAGTDPRTFFVADDVLGLGPYRVMVAAELFAEAVKRGGPLPFKFKCRSEYGECGNGGAKAVAAAFRPPNIARVSQVDCAKPHQMLRTVGPDACYSVETREIGESLLLEIVDAYSELRLKRIEYGRSMVIID